MDKNIKLDFPDVETLECGTWSKYGKLYKKNDGDIVEIGLYREPMNNEENAGHLSLQIFDGDEVVYWCDLGEIKE